MPRESMNRLFDTLREDSDVQLDGQPIRVSEEPVVPHGRVDDAPGGFVVSVGPDLLSLFAHDDRRAGILAHGQDTAGRDVGILQQIPCDEMIVGRGVLVVEDTGELLEVPRPEKMRRIIESLRRQFCQAGALHGKDIGPVEFFQADMVGAYKQARISYGHGKYFGVVYCSRRGGSSQSCVTGDHIHSRDVKLKAGH